MVGITITTAALLILIAAFNGIESMIEQLYSKYEPSISIRSAQGKTFAQDQLKSIAFQEIPGYQSQSRCIEEIVIIQQDQKWANATLRGVEPAFLTMTEMEKHTINGFPKMKQNGQSHAIIGALLLDRISAYFNSKDLGQILIHFPKRNAKVAFSSNPFNTELVPISARINYNKEVNSEAIILPIDFAQEALDYGSDITCLFISFEEKYNIDKIQAQVQNLVGSNFIVETQFDKNKLIYQTSKTEKVIVIAILVFIFILSSFNLVATLTMLFIEKEQDIQTLHTLGANKKNIFQIFFFEGLLICLKGIVFGTILGSIVCFSQIYFHLIEMPNTNGEPFPIRLRWTDYALVLFLVGTLSTLFSSLSIKYLNRTVKQAH